tara:strand:+ start:3643 stop:3909 length:267 start_codon:yes stop_codon:yes gene_type:complete
MLIDRNTVCYTSERGHKNFWYPSDHKVIVKESCSAQQVSWISGGPKIAIRILKENLVPLDISQEAILNMSPPAKSGYTIVWIERCFKN